MSRRRSSNTQDKPPIELARGFCLYRVPRDALANQLHSEKHNRTIPYLEWHMTCPTGRLEFRFFTDDDSQLSPLKGQMAVFEFFVIRSFRQHKTTELVHLIRRKESRNPSHQLHVLPTTSHQDADTVFPLYSVPGSAIALFPLDYSPPSATVITLPKPAVSKSQPTKDGKIPKGQLVQFAKP